MQQPVLVRTQGHTKHLTLSQPEKGNSLSGDMVTALMEAIAHCHTDGTRLLVISGAGKHFCTGFDLGNLDEASDDMLLARFVRIELLLQAVHTAPFPVVALGHGRVVGAGADLFAACQHRVVVDAASFRFPGAAFGLVLGSGRLARLVGTSTARDWIDSGRWIDHDEALAHRLCDTLVQAGEVDALLARLADDAARLDADTRRQIYQATAGANSCAQDMLALVASAARPGLVQRIQAFRAGVIKKPATQA